MTTATLPPRCSTGSSRSCRSLLLAALLAFALWNSQPLLAQAPGNDSFASATLLSGSTNIVTGSNTAATSELGEPAHAGNPASASVWWTWVAPDNGPVVIDTLGSAFDTVLAVYTGNTVGALTLVAANDDAPNLSTSLLAFPAVRGTTYRIAVDGYLGANGSVQLRLHLPVAPAAPDITSQPVGRTVPDNAGSNVTFSVTATGSFPLVFEWQKGGVALPGGTNDSYTVTNATIAKAGDYRVVITNSSGSITSSVAVLTVLAGLAQDAFAGRVTFAGQTNTVTGHNFGATTEAGEPLHAGVTNGASIWWSWTAPQHGLVRLDTAGSTNSAGTVLDTVLAVYTGTSVNSLTPVAANNDEAPGLLSSRLFFRAVAGVTYQFAVAGVRDINGTVPVGNITLNLAQAPNNDFFANALLFPPGATKVLDNNIGTTTEPGEPAHVGNIGGKSVWWYWVAPSNGTYALDTVGSLTDTLLAVYTGTTLGTLSVVGEDDNRSDGGASLVKFFATGGTTYRFAVDGFAGTNGVSEGAIVLNLNPALVLNDNFGDRVTLSGQTNQVTGSNLSAGKELGEPNHGGNTGGRSIWWTWTARLDGPVLVTTRNSTFDTALAVYTGTALGSLVLVGENDDTDPFNPAAGSVVVFPGVAGQTYQIAVDGYRSDDGTVAAGTVQLSLVQASASVPGGNDQFVNRYPITGQSKTVVGVSTNASKEAGEPFHSGNRGGRSVWWSWVAPASGPVTLKTFGSTFDTLLGVYLGTDVGSLTEVANATPSYGEGRSIVTFEAVQGAEYHFAVDGYNNGVGAGAGRVVLSLFQHPPEPLHANDAFENAAPISAPFLTVQSANVGATREPGEPAHKGLQQGHSLWWTWTAPADGPVTIATTNSEFDTTLSVYTGASLTSLSLVAENDDINAGNVQSSVTFSGVAGTVYRIAVDGYGNRVGFITLTVSPWPMAPSAPQILQPPVDQTRFLGGSGGGSSARFQVRALGAAPLFYQWLFNGTNLAGETNTILTVANVAATNAGIYQVTVSNAFGLVTSAAAQLTSLAVPFNDAFADRILLTGISNAVRGSILGARDEPSRVDAANGGRVVWWQWTAPADGPVEIHTVGSSHDTLLAVYTGTAVDSLLLVTENHDFLGEAGSGPSRVVFNAVAGQGYQIAIGSFKTNYAAGGVMLTVRQPPPPPLIVEHPRSPNGVSVTNAAFTLGVTAEGLTPLFKYQWLFNGSPIPNATNATHALGPLSRTKSGLYAVTITNDFGSVTSSNADVWVQVPQLVQAPQRLPDGRVQLHFSDPDGTISANPSRFEVHHTLNPSGPATVWVTNVGGITLSGGLLRYEDQSSGGVTRRIYRVIEK
jgi:hypothetical protein